MNSYFVKRPKTTGFFSAFSTNFAGAFSLREIRQGLKTNALNPEWLAAENPEGESFAAFEKRGAGRWVRLADLHTICPQEELAAFAADDSQFAENAPLTTQPPDQANDLTLGDWAVCVLFPPIAFILGVLRLVLGKRSGGKMIGMSILLAFVWAVARHIFAPILK